MNDKIKAAHDSIALALSCDLDCSWRVLEAVQVLLSEGITIEEILAWAEEA